MRIEGYSQITQLYNASKPRTAETVAGSASFMDKLNISSAGKDLQVAKQAVENAPDVRAAKIAGLKESIADGTYDVSGEDFADKIMEKISQALA